MSSRTSTSSSNSVPNLLNSEVYLGFTILTASAVIGFSIIWTDPMNIDIEYFQLEPDDIKTIEVIGNLCLLLGSIVSAYLADLFGRSTVMVMSTAPVAVSLMTLTVLDQGGSILIARFVCLYSMGMLLTSHSVYLGEVSDANTRNTYCCMSQVGIKFSIIMSKSGKYFWHWRQVATMYGMIPLIFYVLLFFLPETPYWFLMKDEAQRARVILKRLRGKKWSDKEYRDMVHQHKFMRKKYENRSVYWLIFKYRRVLIIIMVLILFQQAIQIGISSIGTFETFLEKARITVSVDVVDLVFSTSSFCGSVAAALLIHIVGAKKLWYISSFTMLKAMGIIMFYYWMKFRTVTKLPLSAFIILLFSYSMGIELTPWYLMVEVIPVEIRSISMVLMSFWYQLVAYYSDVFIETSTMIFPMALLSGVIVISSLFVHRYMPVNDKKTLWEIQKSFMINSRDKSFYNSSDEEYF